MKEPLELIGIYVPSEKISVQYKKKNGQREKWMGDVASVVAARATNDTREEECLRLSKEWRDHLPVGFYPLGEWGAMFRPSQTEQVRILDETATSNKM